jgi:hypothetical protein
MTLYRRKKCPLLGLGAAFDGNTERIQKLVNDAPRADFYCFDLRKYVLPLQRRAKCFLAKLNPPKSDF